MSMIQSLVVVVIVVVDVGRSAGGLQCRPETARGWHHDEVDWTRSVVPGAVAVVEWTRRAAAIQLNTYTPCVYSEPINRSQSRF